MNKPYNPYNLVPARNASKLSCVAGGPRDFSQYYRRKRDNKIHEGLQAIKRNFQLYKPFLPATSKRLFWLSAAITISFVLSQIYLILAQ